jgi:hypothetical protein
MEAIDEAFDMVLWSSQEVEIDQPFEVRSWVWRGLACRWENAGGQVVLDRRFLASSASS